MSEELKPCPFCGGEAKHNKGGNSVYGRFWYAVWCEECRIEMHDQEKWIDGGKLDPSFPPKECFSRWNTRANATLIAAAPELLEAMKNAVSQLERMVSDGLSSGAIAAIAKAEGRT